MDKQAELKIKEDRLWDYLESQGLDGVLISKRSNFAWITGGADNRIFLSSEAGASSLLITRDGKYLLAHWMDGERMMDEELAGLGYKLEQYPWYAGRQKTLEALTTGKRIGTDIPTPGLVTLEKDWYELFFPLTPTEVQRARELACLAEEAMREVCFAIQPGDTEQKVAGMLTRAYTGRGMYQHVLLVGSDERLFKYRHCLPKDKPIRNLVLMHVAAQCDGLYANLTRLVHFGPLSEDLQRRHKAVTYIQSILLANLIPGSRFVDLMDKIKAAYAETGFADEWQGHVQGGPCGYEPIWVDLVQDPEAVVPVNQTYDWLQTVPGTKVEELSLLTQDGADLISLAPGWPELRYEIGGRLYRMPDILER